MTFRFFSILLRGTYVRKYVQLQNKRACAFSKSFFGCAGSVNPFPTGGQVTRHKLNGGAFVFSAEMRHKNTVRDMPHRFKAYLILGQSRIHGEEGWVLFKFSR